MAENPRKMKSGGTDIPVVMTWIGTHRLCLTKEEAAKRRPPNSSSMPVAFDRIEVSPRDLANLETDLASAKSDDAAPSAQIDQAPGRRDSDSLGAE